jgi:hypothetical protein
MLESWVVENCPQCTTRNWVNLGDLSDIAAVDIEAIKCWRCERKFFLDPENVQDIHWNEVQQWCQEKTEYETPDDLLNALTCEWGRKDPTDPLRLCLDDEIEVEESES